MASKMDQILKNQAKLERLLKKTIQNQDEILSEEKIETKSQEDELAELTKLEKEIDQQAKVHPLKKISLRDAIKATVGAFVGIVGHFAFVKGIDFATHLSITRSIVLLLTGYALLLVILYYSGFRAVQQTKLLHFIPIRATIIYGVSIITILAILILYGYFDANIIVQQVSAMILLACLGAGAADLIGKSE